MKKLKALCVGLIFLWGLTGACVENPDTSSRIVGTKSLRDTRFECIQIEDPRRNSRLIVAYEVSSGGTSVQAYTEPPLLKHGQSSHPLHWNRASIYFLEKEPVILSLKDAEERLFSATDIKSEF